MQSPTPPRIINSWIPPAGDRVIIEFNEELSHPAGALPEDSAEAFVICHIDATGCLGGIDEAKLVRHVNGSVSLHTAQGLDGSTEVPCDEGDTPCVANLRNTDQRRFVRIVFNDDPLIHRGQFMLLNYQRPPTVTAALKDETGNLVRNDRNRSIANYSRHQEPACENDDVWCATMTAASSSGKQGYDETQSIGTMSDTTFSHLGKDYTVSQVLITGENMNFSISPGGADVFQNPGFGLYVGAQRYSFGDAGRTPTAFTWEKQRNLQQDMDYIVRLVEVDTPEASQQAPPSEEALTGSWNSVPRQHDGGTILKIRVLFSEDIDTAAADLPGAFTATNATIGPAGKVDDRSDLWEVRFTPTSDDDITITLAAVTGCSADHAPCTADDRPLQGALTLNIAGPNWLEGTFDNAPIAHDGTADFNVWMRFNRPITASWQNFHLAFEATGGTVESAEKINGQSDFWNLTIRPSGVGNVTISLPGNKAHATGPDGQTQILMSNSPETTIPGPNPISIQDAGGEADQSIIFTVSLGRRTLQGVTVDYATQDATATAGEDYTSASGTLTFSLGDQEKTISVLVLAGAGGGETFTLTLSNPTGGYLQDGSATGAITASNNSSATGNPVIMGTAQVGSTLTADTLGIADLEGLDDATFSYRWIAGGSDIIGAHSNTYTLTQDEKGLTIQVWVSFTDDEGNPETAISAATAAVAGALLTVSLETVPASHDGTGTTFTFEIAFSEEVELGYETLRDHAFTVTGGSVNKAERTDAPSNIGWRITIGPSGNGDVRVQMPVTKDCTAQGAACTDDGRKLSNPLDFTIPGGQ